MKSKWSPLKEILFTYLAISKVMYWFNTITYMNQQDFGNIWEAVLMRLLNHDLIIIIGVVIFYFLDKLVVFKKTKKNKILEHIIYYAIGYVIIVGITFIYIQITMLIFEFTVYSWSGYIIYGTIGYIAVVVVLNIKHYSKEKLKPKYNQTLESEDDKLSVLKLLCEDGTLTQEEFENCKDRLSNTKS